MPFAAGALSSLLLWALSLFLLACQRARGSHGHHAGPDLEVTSGSSFCQIDANSCATNGDAGLFPGSPASESPTCASESTPLITPNPCCPTVPFLI